jgi:hypothetical protein
MKLEETKPIVVVTYARSGSTLLLRLLNKCHSNANNSRMSFNGELDILDYWCKTIKALRECNNRGEKTKEALEADNVFLSHYHNQTTVDAIQYLKEFWWKYCGETEYWGWKMVNYGIADNWEYFETMMDQLVIHYPEIRFIIIDRETEDVYKSMLNSKWWKNQEKGLRKRLTNQTRNFTWLMRKYANRVKVLPYEVLLDREQFQTFIYALELNISDDDYVKITSKIIKDDSNDPISSFNQPLLAQPNTNREIPKPRPQEL